MSFNHYGHCTTDPADEEWKADQIRDELAGGFIGALMDCYDQLSRDDQADMLADLGVFDKAGLLEAARRDICPLLDLLFHEECRPPTPEEDDPIAFALKLSEWCHLDIIDRLLAHLDACAEDDLHKEHDKQPLPDDLNPDPTVDPTGKLLYTYIAVTTRDQWPGHEESWPPATPLLPDHYPIGVTIYSNLPYSEWHSHEGTRA